MTLLRLAALASVLGTVVVSAPTPGHAARKRAKTKTTAPAPRPELPADKLAKLRQVLLGTDDTLSVTAAEALGESRASNAASPLVDVLAAGARPPVVAASLTALQKLSDPRAFDVLVLYTGNRSAPVRKLAVEALAKLTEARVGAVLADRLGDPSAEVRAVAAEALAARNDKSATERMLALFKRNDPGAAAPLGKLASPAMVPAIAELRGRVDDGNLASALGEFLKRPDVADPLRVDVIKTLSQLPGPETAAALAEYVGSIPDGEDRPSKKAAEQAMEEGAQTK